MAKSDAKPRKLYADFPLFAHQNGQWAKTIRERKHYFGVWGDPDAALQEYLRVRDDVQAGRTPTPAAGVVDLAHACNAYLARAEQRYEAGELSYRSFADYRDICQLAVSHWGRAVDPAQLRPADFASFRQSISHYASGRLNKIVVVTRMVLKWAYESELIDQMPRFGPDFKGVTKRKVRQEKAAAGEKMFSAEEIQTLLAAAGPVFRAMILLGVNGGLGNTDISTLRRRAINLKSGWVKFSRQKTGVDRRFPLWPETVEALWEAKAARPKPARHKLADRVFLTRFGNEWCPHDRRDNQISMMFRRLIKRCGLYRKGRSFYSLRHNFETIAGESQDQIAVDYVMGHSPQDMASVYRERISDERLRAVTDHVRAWLFSDAMLQPQKRHRLKVVG